MPLYELNNLACKKNIPIIFSSHLKNPEHNERIKVNKNDVIGNQSIYASASDVWSIHKSIKPEFEDHFLFSCIITIAETAQFRSINNDTRCIEL